ncbi:MAG TPA: long-chain fatty acid--CoA ligase [Myxococcales bacterium]|jgi:long-chain acyl-CoA synthetase
MERRWVKQYEAHVPASLEVPDSLLPACLSENARGPFADRTATIFYGTKLTYRALDAAVDRFAAGLQRIGIVKGDRVAIFLPNCPQYVIAFYGALRAGCIAVPCNPLYVARELEHQLKDSGARVLVCLSGFYSRVREARAHTPALEHVLVANIKEHFPFHLRLAFTLLKEEKEGHRVDLSGEPAGTVRFPDFLEKAPATPEPVALSSDDSACLLYTGGTTGVPKGAELSHRNLFVNAYQCHVWFNTRLGNEVVPCALPFSHGYGMTTCLNYGIFAASTLLLIPNPRELSHVLEVMSRHRATFLPGVPTLFVALADFKGVSRYDLRSVRACISGGAPLTRAAKERFEALTGGKVVEGYGLSEASPVTHANPVYSGTRVGSIGLPWPGVDCRVTPIDDASVEVALGEVGEMWVRGPQVMKSYWKNPEETARVLSPDGWLRTGDLCSVDADGFFTLAARKKDLIIAGGYKIYPQEVEEVLEQHPKVSEAAAMGVPHPYRGETVKAFIVPKPGERPTEEELVAFCHEKLARYKVPTAFEIRAELPKTALGKVLRRKLREEAAVAAPPPPATNPGPEQPHA